MNYKIQKLGDIQPTAVLLTFLSSTHLNRTNKKDSLLPYLTPKEMERIVEALLHIHIAHRKLTYQDITLSLIVEKTRELDTLKLQDIERIAGELHNLHNT